MNTYLFALILIIVAIIILLVVFIWRINATKMNLMEYFRHNWSDIFALIPIYFIVFQFFGIVYPTPIIKIFIVIKIIIA